MTQKQKRCVEQFSSDISSFNCKTDAKTQMQSWILLYDFPRLATPIPKSLACTAVIPLIRSFFKVVAKRSSPQGSLLGEAFRDDTKKEPCID